MADVNIPCFGGCLSHFWYTWRVWGRITHLREILPIEDIWKCPELFFCVCVCVSQPEREGSYWHLVSSSQRCCSAPKNVQYGTLHPRMIRPRTSLVPGLRNPVAGTRVSPVASAICSLSLFLGPSAGRTLDLHFYGFTAALDFALSLCDVAAAILVSTECWEGNTAFLFTVPLSSLTQRPLTESLNIKDEENSRAQ